MYTYLPLAESFINRLAWHAYIDRNVKQYRGFRLSTV